MTTRPTSSIEVESEAHLHLSNDEFMTAVDRDEFLEVTSMYILHSLTFTQHNGKSIKPIEVKNENYIPSRGKKTTDIF